MRLASVVLLACAVAVRADDKDELKKLEGTWEIVLLEGGGKEVPKGKGAPEKLTIKDGKMTGFGPEIRLSTDATKKPKWLSMTFTREGKDATVNAIYELNGEELKICLPLAPAKGSGAVFENKRPESFDTKDKAEMLIKAKRIK
jgi:uncharacterized protein (TIGR03067 family)